MRRLILGLTIATALIAPATASATTAAQARQAVSAKLTQVYGGAWRTHTPSWSRPECRAPQRPQDFICLTAFEHGGVWRIVSATVNGHKVQIVRTVHWTRRWRVSKPSCTNAGETSVVGQLSSNDANCYQTTLWQNFGHDRHGKIRYTRFMPSVLVYGTASLAWPDFNVFKCRSSSGTYQCLNRFGNGFRWKPNASTSPPPPTTEFYAAVPGGRIGCGIGPAAQILCIGFPAATAERMPVAMLRPDGTVTSCTQSYDDPECFQGDLGERTPTIAAGKDLTIAQYHCAVSDTGVQCTITASGKGFEITLQQVTAVGGATVTPG
jgi:hypothetical protein